MKKNNILGYILGIICGFIFSIPWILIFVLFGLSIGYLSILIVVGIIIGYKLICKEMYNNKKTKIYLILSSSFIALINTLIVIPIFTIASIKGINILSNLLDFENTLSLNNLLDFYKTKSYIESSIINSILSVSMVIIPSIFLPYDFKNGENKLSNSEESLNIVKSVFEKHNALSKDTAVSKKVIREEKKLLNISGLKKFFIFDMVDSFRVKRKKGKLYFKEKQKPFKYGVMMSIFVLIWFTLFWNMFMKFSNINEILEQKMNIELKNNTKNITYKADDKFSIVLPECMYEYKKDHRTDDVESYYYQYATESDIKTDINTVQIYYYPEYDMNTYYDVLKEKLRTSFGKYNIVEENDIMINNNKSMYFKVDKMSDNNMITYIYFTQIDNKMFETYIFIDKEKDSLDNKKISDSIIESIKLMN